ncbi:MAG TPA: UDP-N-acetylmuramate dehydrogenase [Desulfuromonadales bacterium]|nr:UDP-N-acetylmuramate dehydrogenase [Desulfuromonadales bacterium]
MGETLFETLRSRLKGTVTADELLCRHTTWRVGGPADLFIVPADREELVTALRLLAAAGVPWVALGAGSNLLVRDGGVRGAVLHTGGLRRLTFAEDGRAQAEGGVPMMTLIREAAARGLAGLEALAGIPGTVGGGIVMNAGAAGQEMADVVREVHLAGPQGEEPWRGEQLQFAYRGSNLPPARVLAAAMLQFRAADPAHLEEVIRRRLQQRQAAQRVGAPNAGSVFKNPEGQQAWRLIDAAGLRGETIGGAQVAERHTNFIVNRGGASAQDILALIDRVREKVLQHSGIELDPEVRIIGDD